MESSGLVVTGFPGSQPLTSESRQSETWVSMRSGSVDEVLVGNHPY